MPAINLNDSINFLSKLTVKRVWNAAKVFGSFYAGRLLKKPVQWGYPISVSFEPTTSCNLRCPECPSGLRSFSRNTGMLQNDMFTNIIDEVSMYRIDFPDSIRWDALAASSNMNISHASLFPDVYGASLFANASLEIQPYLINGRSIGFVGD